MYIQLHMLNDNFCFESQILLKVLNQQLLLNSQLGPAYERLLLKSAVLLPFVILCNAY